MSSTNVRMQFEQKKTGLCVSRARLLDSAAGHKGGHSDNGHDQFKCAAAGHVPLGQETRLRYALASGNDVSVCAGRQHAWLKMDCQLTQCATPSSECVAPTEGTVG